MTKPNLSGIEANTSLDRLYSPYDRCDDGNEADYLTVECPRCHRRADVTSLTTMACVTVPILVSNGTLEMDWPNADIKGEFDYRCSACDYVIARDLDELSRIAAEQAKPKEESRTELIPLSEALKIARAYKEMTHDTLFVNYVTSIPAYSKISDKALICLAMHWDDVIFHYETCPYLGERAAKHAVRTVIAEHLGEAEAKFLDDNNDGGKENV